MFYRVISRKLLFDGEKMAVGWDFRPSPVIYIKIQGKGGQSTSSGCNNFLTFWVRKEIPGV